MRVLEAGFTAIVFAIVITRTPSQRIGMPKQLEERREAESNRFFTWIWTRNDNEALEKKEKRPEDDRDRLFRQVPSLIYKGRSRQNPDAFPLSLCEGDCSSDRHCEGELLCFERKSLEPVPGCKGQGDENIDYCFDPNPPQPSAAPSNAEPTISPVPSATPTTMFPSASPSISIEPSTSFEPTYSPTISYAPSESPSASPTLTASPTFSPSSSPTDQPSTSPTGAPTRVDLIVLDDSMKPFGKCEGQCSDDNDCRDGLYCQKRGGLEFVPGCFGTGSPGVNFCYDKVRDGPAPPTMPSGSFRLRLYWEKEYFWQETHKETKWCLTDGNPPEVHRCRGSSTKFEFVYVAGQGDMIKVRGKNRCLDRTGNTAVSWQGCDPNDPNQRWLGNWPARRFDIRSVMRNDGCLSQHHHPKSGEVVFLNACLRAHLTDTGYWNRY